MAVTQPRETVWFVQWIRVLVTSLVVGLHAAQPYGPTGGAWAVSDPANSDWLFPFLAINAVFLMGFFFFIAADFLEGRYDREGASGFLKGRLVRLGIPLAFMALVYLPLGNWLSSPRDIGLVEFLWRDTIGALAFDFGHRWFLFHLLIYSALHVLWRALTGPAQNRPGLSRSLPMSSCWAL